MRDLDELQTQELNELATRLPREAAPPADLWPRIEAELERPSLESLTRGLARAADPPAELWPRIEARLDRPRKRRQWLAAAAAAFAALSLVIIGIANRNAGGNAAPELALAAQIIRQNLTLVRSERQVIERAIEQDPPNAHLREVWANAYEAELRLENEMSRLNVKRGYGI